MRARWGVVPVSLLLLLGLGVLPGPSASADRGAESRADARATPGVPRGLTQCRDAWPTYCGMVDVPLDRTGRTPGRIPIRFEYYPAKQPSDQTGTIVAMEGGPGYATTKSRDYYLDLFTPSMRHNALLLVDQRGTGRSRPLNCPEAQSYDGNWVLNAAACGRRLGARSDLYTTAAAADDLDAVLSSLHIETVDVYGDSYGSFSAQTFATRYPDRVRSLVLDGTYPIEGLDPWYRTTATRLRDNLRLFCSQSTATCPVQPSEMVALTRRVVSSVRERPLSTTAPNARGKTVPVTITPRRLLDTLLYSDVTPGYVREIPAALVAFESGNPLPLARMVAEANGASTSSMGDKVPRGPDWAELRAFSEGAYLAYACTDYPQLWNVEADRQGRNAQFDRATSRLDPYELAPWTGSEWSESEFFVFDYCIGWPEPRVAESPFPGNGYPDTPTLVLNGALDLRTDVYQAREVAAHFPEATYVEVPNYGHVTALYDPDHCTSVIVRRFVRTLDAGDTSCVESIPEHRVVSSFPKKAAQSAQATVGNRRDESRAADRRAAYVAVESVADVIDRWYAIPGYRGTSLYGGRFAMFTTYSDPFVSRVWSLKLDRLRWTKDIAVSGKGTMPRGPGTARVKVTISGKGSAPGSLVLTWPTREQHAVVTITGTIGKRTVDLRAPAPSYY